MPSLLKKTLRNGELAPLSAFREVRFIFHFVAGFTFSISFQLSFYIILNLFSTTH